MSKMVYNLRVWNIKGAIALGTKVKPSENRTVLQVRNKISSYFLASQNLTFHRYPKIKQVFAQKLRRKVSDNR